MLGCLIPACLSLALIACLVLQSGEEVDGDVDGDDDDDVEYDSDERERMRELISKKLQREKGAEKAAELGEDERGKKPSRRYDAAALNSFCSVFLLSFLKHSELDIFLSL